MATAEIDTKGLPPEVDDWRNLLKELVDNIKTWSEAAGWKTRLTGRDVNETGVARYEVPVLVMDRDEAEIALVPVAREIPGADGLVAFYRMPDFDDVASLYREEGRWTFRYAFYPDTSETRSGIEAERFPLDEAGLDRVLNDIAAHA